MKNPDLHRAIGLEHIEQSFANHLLLVWRGHRRQPRSVKICEGVVVVAAPRVRRPAARLLSTPVST